MESASLLHLSLIESIGPGVVEKLLQSLPRSMSLYELKVQDFMALGLTQNCAQRLFEGLSDETLLEKELSLIGKNDISWTTFLDKEYPFLLKEIYLPPIVLYWKGDLSILKKQAVAFVGSRAANYYGARITKKLVQEVVPYEIVTVSGGAYGIDTHVHQATLDCGGETVAVLGSGLLKPYPAQNKKLFEEIFQKSGAVVSSFPLMMEALPGNFPARNRIISGVSLGTIVVQAAQKSGALITAEYALHQGRIVGAVPGAIDDPLSAGCHTLLQNGARLIQSGADIIEELGIESARNETVMTLKREEDPLVVLCEQPIAFEDLFKLANMSEDTLKERLFSLQLDGKLEQDFAGLWRSV